MAAGHSIRLMSRRRRPASENSRSTSVVGNLATGAGLSEAVADIEAIVHAASDPRKAREVDVQGTRRLVEAARAAGVAHIAYVSIVGVDRIPYRYYESKLEAERVLAKSGVPYSILRATQFHSFVSWLLAQVARFPMFMPIPLGFHVQSVATEEVAARLCRALDDGPAGMLRDFAGPEIMPIETAAQVWSAHRPQRWLTTIVPIYLPGKTAAAFRAGYNTAPDGERGTLTWREWLVRSMEE
jgi:uncharacterized protein YbjT (DUF2867 family)